MTKIELLPSGYRLFFIFVSLAKYALLTPGIKPSEKLRLLEILDSFSDQYMKPEMVAMVGPMCDTAYAIYREAKSLDRSDGKSASASVTVLTGERVFKHFVALNPSILKAIEWREAHRGHAVATPAAAPAVTLPAPSSAPPPPYGYDIPDRFLQRGHP